MSHPQATTIATPWWRPQASGPGAQAFAGARGLGEETTAYPGSGIAFAALVAFTAILLLSPQIWFPVLKLVRIAFVAAGMAIAAHVVERTAHRQPITPLSPEIGIAIALVGWAILTLPLSVWPGGSVRVLTDHYLKAIVFFWLLGTIVTTERRLSMLAWTLTLCSIPLAGTGVSNYLAGEVLSTGVRGFYRITGYTGVLTANPNDLALMLNLIIPITGALAFSASGGKRLLAIGALLLSVTAVILTYSRAGFLTLAASFVLFLAVLSRRRMAGGAAVLLALALCIPPLLPDDYITRLGTITDIRSDVTGSAQGRWRDTKVAMSVVARHPIVGAGIGQDILVMNEERGDTWRRVHNAYLQYGVDLGIPGLLLFAWLHVTCFRIARAVERRVEPTVGCLQPLATGVRISLVAFGVAAFFHPIAYQFYFFTIAGLAVALRNACRAGLAGPPDRLRQGRVAPRPDDPVLAGRSATADRPGGPPKLYAKAEGGPYVQRQRGLAYVPSGAGCSRPVSSSS